MADDPTGGGGSPVDPKIMEAQIAGTEQYRDLLFQISSIESQLAQTEAERLQYAQQAVQTFDAGLKQTLQMAEATGRVRNDEERRNLVLKEEVGELRLSLIHI